MLLTTVFHKTTSLWAHSMLYLSDRSKVGRQMLQVIHIMASSLEPGCATTSHLFSGLSYLPILLRPALWRMVAAVACHPVNKYHNSSFTFLCCLENVEWMILIISHLANCILSVELNLFNLEVL